MHFVWIFQVLLNSTDLERCFQSGLSHIAALYAPTTEWIFENSLNWQPISMHYFPHETDRVNINSIIFLEIMNSLIIIEIVI